MAKKEDKNFAEALAGKKLPPLTLDNKWYQMFATSGMPKDVQKLADDMNVLLEKQGQLNNDIKDLKRLKQKLMNEIVSGIDEVPLSDKQMEEHTRLINDCNKRVEEKQDALLDLPPQIDEINYELMVRTMEYTYEFIDENTDEILKIGKWIAEVRVELKKNIIRKQERELQNQAIYSYMHNIFGPDVIEIFDMKYNPEDQIKKQAEAKAKKEAATAEKKDGQ